MAKAKYRCSTEGAVALAAATAKTAIGVKGHANSNLELKVVKFGFDGVTPSAVPILIELGYCTWATNSPGTNSTSTTPRQPTGNRLTAGFTSGKTWTTEPTAITVLDDMLLTPNGGTLWYDFPLSEEWDSALGEGFVLRFTAPAIVNVRALLGVERG